MKHNAWISLMVALVAGIMLHATPMQAGVARDITTDTGWRYLKGTNEPPSNWHTRDYDDSAWAGGAMPFWYGDGTNGTQLGDMQNSYSTLYLRYTFTNYNAIAITSMVFSADYDDAFIVWLNDVEVYRTAGAPASPTYNSISTVSHESSAGSPPGMWETNILLNPSETYFIWPGGQKISVQVFNSAVGSSDLHFNMKVVANNMFVSNAIKVACVGSSTTQGHQNVPNSFHTSYPMFLQLMLGPGYEVRNYGHNGKTLMRTLTGYTRDPDPFADNPTTPGWYHSVEWKPDMVCIQLGVNDAHTNRNWNGNKQNYTSEYDYLVTSYTNHSGTPTRIYCGTPPWVGTNGFNGSYIGNPDNVDGWDWGDDGNLSNLQVSPMVRSYAAVRGYYMIDVEAFTEGHWPDWYNAGGIDALHMSTIGHSNVAICVSNGMRSPAIQIQGGGEWLVDGASVASAHDQTDFGSAPTVGGTVDHVFTITNFGVDTLTLSGSPRVVVSGSDFSVVSQPAASVGAKGSTSFTIRFDPTVVGLRTATATLANNDFTKPQFDFALQGSGTASAGPSNWTAYNDCAWQADDAGDVTSTFTTNNPGILASGSLKTEGGQALSSTVTITTNGAGFNFMALTTNVIPWPGGVDATAEFSGKIGKGYVCEIQGSNASVTVALDGLQTNKQYRLVVWCSRLADGSNYSNRLTDVVLMGADSFVNGSTSTDGVTRFTTSMANDSTTIRSTFKDGYGPVVMYQQVRSGTDGSISFHVRRNAASAGNAYLNAFKLVESDISAGIPDTDADGMDDTWEQLHFGGLSQPNGGSTQDFDSDGFDNYSEYRAGTDPQSAMSRLEMSGVAAGTPGQIVVQWGGVTGKTYSIEIRTNLSSGAWSAIQSGVPGGAINAYTGAATAGAYYYRVKVE